MTLYLLCGSAFAGKSTLAAAISARIDAVVISLDEINAQRGLFGGLGVAAEEWAKSHQAARALAEAALSRGLDVVVDDTNCFRFLRDDYRAVADRCRATCVVIHLDTPFPVVRGRLRANELTRARPRVTEKILLELAHKFEAPDSDEPTLRFAEGADPAQWVIENLRPPENPR